MVVKRRASFNCESRNSPVRGLPELLNHSYNCIDGDDIDDVAHAASA